MMPTWRRSLDAQAGFEPPEGLSVCGLEYGNPYADRARAAHLRARHRDPRRSDCRGARVRPPRVSLPSARQRGGVRRGLGAHADGCTDGEPLMKAVSRVLGALGTLVIVATGATLRAQQPAQQPQKPADQPIVVEAPSGGWNVSGLVDDSEKVAVAYPPSPIDRGAQKHRTLIRGRLAAVNNDRPHRLIVNGNPMPLYVGEDGRFARPYAFGVGSNSIEVRSPDGKERRSGSSSTRRIRRRLRRASAWCSGGTTIRRMWISTSSPRTGSTRSGPIPCSPTAAAWMSTAWMAPARRCSRWPRRYGASTTST